VLGLPPLPRTLEAALRDVASKKPEIRAEAIRELVRYSDDARPQIVRSIEGALRDDDPRVRGLAAMALSDIGAKEALPTLLVAVEDEDAYVRQMAISALGEIGDPRAGERLRRALADARSEVRFQAVMAFPRVTARREDALDAVLSAMDDKDALVAHVALRMAEELGDGRDPDARVLAKAKALLAHDAPAVRVAAAVLLAHAGDRSGTDILAKVAGGTLETTEGEDEAAAIELCGELGLRETERGLARRAFGGVLGLRRDRYQWHARVALARMGNERAIREILAELASWDPGKRTLAVAAAGRARITAARDAIRAMRDAPDKADPDAVEDALRALSAEPGSRAASSRGAPGAPDHDPRK
jgi:HEAT repeat protein